MQIAPQQERRERGEESGASEVKRAGGGRTRGQVGMHEIHLRAAFVFGRL